SGTDPRTEQNFVDLQAHVGGWGAWRGSDGENGVINAVNSQVKDFPIEVVETKVPVRITRYGFRPDSGGLGQWRGGCGIVREYLVDCDDLLLTAWFERSVTPAWGLAGGGAARPPQVTINPGRDDERTLLKASVLPLKRGDVVRAETGGGGGYGDPAERDPEATEADAATGLASRP
ncbi:MAG: hydantoinase B/oxoprolinase family protein, partial [Gaiellaceae bacterium]